VGAKGFSLGAHATISVRKITMFNKPLRWLFFALLALQLIFLYRLFFGEGSYAQQVDLSRQVAQQKARNELLEERNRILAEEVEGLRDDPEAIEERARTDLGMVKAGETFFLVLEKRQEVQHFAPTPAPENNGEDEVEARDAIPEGLFEE
jgi:cell division protein FtsB